MSRIAAAMMMIMAAQHNPKSYGPAYTDGPAKYGASKRASTLSVKNRKKRKAANKQASKKRRGNK